LWPTWRTKRSWACTDSTVTLALDYADAAAAAAPSLLCNEQDLKVALAKIDATEGADLAVSSRV
jgi:hypothetical protein